LTCINAIKKINRLAAVNKMHRWSSYHCAKSSTWNGMQYVCFLFDHFISEAV